KADNWTAFTDGYRTWINGPLGLQERLNTGRFSWETAIPPAPPTPTPAPVATPPPSTAPSPTPATTQVPANTATDRSGLILDPQILIDGPFSTVLLHVGSSSASQVHIDRVVIAPPPGAVVDASVPEQSLIQNGVAWYTDTLVDKDDPLTGYFVRFWGSAN